VRRSEFDRAVADEFGAQGGYLLTDLALPGFDGRSAAQVLASGVPPRDVWLALCAEMDVPPNRRYGVGRLEPRGR